jgi:signal peptidase I
MTQAKNKTRQWLHEWLPSILLICLILVTRSTLADHYHVPSGSMEPTLQPGDHVMVYKAAYGLRIPFTKHVIALQGQPERGEVVIFDSPEDDIRLIKRVVAIGGDEVAVLSGRVFINGEPLMNTNATGIEVYNDREVELRLDNGGGPGMAAITVPRGHVLVLGDHRGNSRDGRFFGTVPVSELYGRAGGVFWRKSSGPIWQSL